MPRPSKKKNYVGIAKRGNFYEFRLRVPDPASASGKKQVRFGGFVTEEEADLSRAKLKVSISERTFALPSSLTVSEYFPECIETHFVMNGKRTQSKDDYQTHLRAYILPRIGEWALKDCDSVRLERFLLELQKTGTRKGTPLSASTMEKVGIVLKIGFKQANKSRLIGFNPMSEVRIPKGQVKKVEHIADFDLIELRKAWKDSDIFVLCELGLVTGLRKGELLCLRWSDFDEDTSTFSITKTVYYSKGIRLENSPKSENGFRKVEITPKQALFLKSHRAKQAQFRLQAGHLWEQSDFIFTNEIGQPLKPAHLYHWWKKVCVSANVKRYHFHSIRHTHITSLLQAGVQPYVVAKRAGDTVSTVLSTYAHSIRQDDSRCAEVFEGKMINL